MSCLAHCRRKFRFDPSFRTELVPGPTSWDRFSIYNPHNCSRIPSRPRSTGQTRRRYGQRLATKAYFAPVHLAITVPTSTAASSDADLFRGGVPQPADWLRAWRACRTPQSFHAAEACGITENFIQGSRVHGASRKAFAAMTKIMCLVIRRRKRTVLEKAQHVAISLDDRQSFRLCRFRCDIPTIAHDGAIVESGCLGVLRRGGVDFKDKALSDADGDHSRAMATSVVRCFQRLATNPINGEVDDRFVDDACKKVRIGLADGGASAQKCLRFLAANEMPNLLWCGRDRAHAVRISTSGPLLAEKTFRSWWDDVFGNRHALALGPSLVKSRVQLSIVLFRVWV
jgi:hypothetical protein